VADLPRAALIPVARKRVRRTSRVAVRVAPARHYVSRARDRVPRLLVESWRESAHGRVARLLSAGNGISLHIALGIVVADVVGVRGQPLGDLWTRKSQRIVACD